MITKLGQIILVIILSACSVSAHEHWALIRQEEGKIVIQICSGHNFPASEFLLAERLVAETTIVDPVGVVTNVKPVASEKMWRAEVECHTGGVWLAEFVLKKPLEQKAFFCGRSLLVLGEADDQTRYVLGKGIEIVPQKPISSLQPGDSLPVSILEDGKPIGGKITVTPENGHVCFLSTGKERPAEIKPLVAGTYLLTASRNGVTVSLTFTVQGSKKEKTTQ